MRYAIITCQIADPDFGIMNFLTLRSFSSNNNTLMHAIADRANEYKLPDQIVRVHRYNSNLPAIRPSNQNRAYLTSIPPLAHVTFGERAEACILYLDILAEYNNVFEAINQLGGET